MYVGKRIKSILSVLLICGLLVVSVPGRAYAAAPLVLTPAIKYAIGAGIVAGGLYAANNDALTYAINDYWNKASDHIKTQWNSAVTYGTGIGIILLNDTLRQSLHDYLEDKFTSGYNTVTLPGEVNPSDGRYKIFVSTDGNTVELFYYRPDNTRTYNTTYVRHTDNEYDMAVKAWLDTPANRAAARQSYLCVIGNDLYGKVFVAEPPLEVTNLVRRNVVGPGATGYAAGIEYGYDGDVVGFGRARPGEDVKIPCPPVPAAEWPDQWVDDLLGEMNRTGNPTLDDETFIEECEREWDWYWDDNVAYIYRVPHGDPPKEPDDEPIRIPIPPPPQPEIPYPQPDPIPQPAEPCPYCPPNPYPSPDGQPCPNPYCPNQPNPMSPPVPQSPNVPAEPCPYCPPNPYPSPNGQPCPNPYCPNQPNQQPVPTPPPDIQPFYDDPEINWEPLRRSLYELTEKFPFSLPWDLMRGVQSMEANQWDRKIRVVIGDEFWPNFEIDLTMFDRLARISRVIMLVIFDLGLIFATRKLMGGDV